MYQFKIDSENTSQLRAFVNNVYKPLDSVSKLEEESILYIQENKLTVIAYGRTAAGAFAQARTEINIKEVQFETPKPTYTYLTMDLNKFLLGLAHHPAGDVTVKVDAKKNALFFNNDSVDDTETFLGYVQRVDDDEFEELLKAIEDMIGSKTPVAEFELTNEKLKALATINSMLNIGLVSNGVEIDQHHIRASDAAVVIEVTEKEELVKLETTKKIDLDIATVPLFKSVVNMSGGSEKLMLYENTPAVINFIGMAAGNTKIVWTTKALNLDYPTTTDLERVLPETTLRTKIKVDIAAVRLALKQFDGLFDNTSWKWGQIEFIYDKAQNNILKMQYSKVEAGEKATLAITCLEDTDTADKHSFYLPTKYLTYILDLAQEAKKESLFVEFNSLGPRVPHGMALRIYTDETDPDIFASICKIIVAT